MILTKEHIDSLDLDKFIHSQINSGNQSKILLIVPTNRKQRNLKKELISLSPGGTADKLNVESLSLFFQKILKNVINFSMISEGTKSVLIRQCSGKVKLQYFSSYESLPYGTLEKIANVISEYKRLGITPQILRNEVQKGEVNEWKKASDIADIYDLFKQKCSELLAFEIGDVYEYLNKLEIREFYEAFNKSYNGIETIIFSGFNEFTKPEILLIDKLSGRPNTKMFLDFDYYYSNAAIFNHIKECYIRLERQGFRRIEDRGLASQSEFLSHLKKYLFLDEPLNEKPDYSGTIKLIESPGREEEIVTISKEVKRLILEEQIKPSDICVTFNLIQNYSSLVRDKFGIYGIPYNLTDRIGLGNSAPVAAVVNLLEILETRFFHKNLFRALSSHLININVDLSNLMTVASELKIISGIDNWKRAILLALKNIEVEEEYNPVKKYSLQKAFKDILEVEKLLAPFNRNLTINEFLEQVEKLAVNSGIAKNILSVSNEYVEENVKGLTAFFETITEVFRLIEIDEGKDKSHPTSYFLDQIRTACKWARFNIKEKSNYGVLVTTLDEIRGLNFRYLFIAGLCDGDLPTRFSPEIFFSGSFRKAEDTRIGEERYLFYSALSSWRQRLYLSLPQRDSKHDLNESVFLKEMRKIFLFGKLNQNEFGKYVFSKEEFLGSVARDRMKNDIEIREILDKAVVRDTDEFIHANEVISSSTKRQQEFNGELMISNDSTVKEEYKLGKEYLPDLENYKKRIYSVSQLEKYALCPYKYFLENVLNISPVEEPLEDIEAIEFGNILHAILFNFSMWQRENNIELRNCSDTIFNEAFEKINELTSEEFKVLERDEDINFYEMEKLFGLNKDPQESILFKYLELERDDSTEFLPKYFEVTFGRKSGEYSDPALSREEPLLVGGVNLQGKIDRVEISDNGQLFNVVDYKSGSKKVSAQEINDGQHLQLPAYLMAVRQLLTSKTGQEIAPAFMYIYSLKFREDSFGKIQIKTSSKKNADFSGENEEMLLNVERHINNYVNAISSGKFNLSELTEREKKVCSYCNFKSVCRVNEFD